MSSVAPLLVDSVRQLSSLAIFGIGEYCTIDNGGANTSDKDLRATGVGGGTPMATMRCVRLLAVLAMLHDDPHKGGGRWVCTRQVVAKQVTRGRWVRAKLSATYPLPTHLISLLGTRRFDGSPGDGLNVQGSAANTFFRMNHKRSIQCPSQRVAVEVRYVDSVITELPTT